MRKITSALVLITLLSAAAARAEEPTARFEISLTPAGAMAGVHAAAENLAANYGASLDATTVNDEGGTFVLEIKGGSVALLHGDPRVRSIRPLGSRAHTSTVQSLDLGIYSYDGSGNIKSIGSDAFRYDLAGRLTSGMVNGSKQTFTYDGFGNRVDAKRAAGAVACFASTDCESSAPVTTTTSTNHLASARATYDAAGNVTLLDATYSYSYDALNMVTRAGTREYIYTPNDERIASVASGAWTWTFRGPSQQVLREFTSTGTDGSQNWAWTHDHIWRGALLLAAEQKTSSGATVVRHFHLDHLGTPRLVTNGAGQRLALHAYYPFGTEVQSATSESPTESIKFTGHEWDDAGGDLHALTYMHARYYSAAMGRFLSVDSHLGSPTVPQSWNRYAYALNDPIGRSDPDGNATRDVVKHAVGIGLILVGAVPVKGPVPDNAVAKYTHEAYDSVTPDEVMALMPLALVDPLEVPSAVPALGSIERITEGGVSYETYTKTNPETGQVYSGRTSGTGTPEQNVARRDAGHHMNAEGYGPAVLDKSSTNKAAIRGREQQLIDAHGGAQSQGGTSGNAINGISPKNPNKPFYMRWADALFGAK